MRDDEILTVDALARWLDVEPQTVREWVEQERIPFFRLDDFVGFRRRTLARWFAQLERENPSNRAHQRILVGSRAGDDLHARINEAVERLESDDPALRLAGILALESAARHSPTGAERLRALLAGRLRTATEAWREGLDPEGVSYLPREIQDLLDVVTSIDAGRLVLRPG